MASKPCQSPDPVPIRLLQGDWGLDRPLQMAEHGGLPADGAAQAAAAIVTFAERIWSH